MQPHAATRKEWSNQQRLLVVTEQSRVCEAARVVVV
jgi:hypothetical protein